MNYGNENDIVSLFYVCQQADAEKMPLSEFKRNLTDESVRNMITDFEKQTIIDAQFQVAEKKKSNESENADPVYVKDIAAIIIMNGLDVHFALNEMELYDLPMFLNAYDQKIRHSLESSRLWAFMQVLPHLSKKVKTPKDLYPFSWEIEDQKEQSEKELEEGKATFYAFMKSGKNNSDV